MVAFDTNILVRYIVQDHKEQAQKATQVTEELTPENPAFISCIVLCEMHWVLKTAYKISKEERLAALKKLLAVAAFDIERLDACTKALKRYEKGAADFSDYLIQEIAGQEGYDIMLTFDVKAQQEPGFLQP